MNLKRFIISVAVLTLLCASCERINHVRHTEDTARADSLIEAAHLAHDSDRILALADSLEATGDFAPIKADYWRGYGHYGKWNQYLCQKYWYEALSLPMA